MTDGQRIGRALVRLGIARQSPCDEGTQQVYGEALVLFPPTVVETSCRTLSLEARPEFSTAFPDLGTIIAACTAETERLKVDTLKLIAAQRPEHEPTYYCLDCRDEPNGWRIWFCRGVNETRTILTQGLSVHACGRMQDHPAHTYAEPCACLPHNPEIARAKARMQASRIKKAK